MNIYTYWTLLSFLTSVSMRISTYWAFQLFYEHIIISEIPQVCSHLPELDIYKVPRDPFTREKAELVVGLQEHFEEYYPGPDMLMTIQFSVISLWYTDEVMVRFKVYDESNGRKRIVKIKDLYLFQIPLGGSGKPCEDCIWPDLSKDKALLLVDLMYPDFPILEGLPAAVLRIQKLFTAIAVFSALVIALSVAPNPNLSPPIFQKGVFNFPVALGLTHLMISALRLYYMLEMESYYELTGMTASDYRRSYLKDVFWHLFTGIGSFFNPPQITMLDSYKFTFRTLRSVRDVFRR